MSSAIPVYVHGRFSSPEVTSLDNRLIITVLSLVAVVCGFAGLLSALPLLMLLAALSFFAIIVREPRFGLYLIVALMAMDPTAYDPLTAPFLKLHQGLPGIKATPVELLLLGSCFAMALRSIATRKWSWPERSLLLTAIAFMCLLLFTLVSGVSKGGDLTIGLWEARALIAVLPLILLVAGTITQRRHVQELATVMTAALSLMLIEQLWRYMFTVRAGLFEGPLEMSANHDGAIILGLLVVIGAAYALWGPDRKQRLFALGIVAVAGFLVLASRRRAAVISSEVALMVVGFGLMITDWRRFRLIAPALLVFALLYAAVFWNNPNSWGQPVRAFRSVFDSQSISERDRSSDTYRDIEIANVMYGIRANPITGLGFGTAYAKPYPLVDLSSIWPFWDYMAHNTILWLWLKGGIVTFMSFWFLIGLSVVQGVRLQRQRLGPFPTAAAAVICAYTVMAVFFAYVELGLVSTRIVILLAIGLGLLPIIERLWATDQVDGQSLASADGPAERGMERSRRFQRRAGHGQSATERPKLLAKSARSKIVRRPSAS